MKKYQYQSKDNKYRVSFHRDPKNNTIVVGVVIKNVNGVSGEVDLELNKLAADELSELIQEIRLKS